MNFVVFPSLGILSIDASLAKKHVAVPEAIAGNFDSVAGNGSPQGPAASTVHCSLANFVLGQLPFAADAAAEASIAEVAYYYQPGKLQQP